MRKCLFLLVLFQLCYSFAAYAEHPRDFTEAKKYARIVWADHRVTFYCGCNFDNHLKIDHKNCGYEAGKRRKAYTVEWEHFLSVSWFGRQRACWRENFCKKKNGERFKESACCEKIDKEFRKMVSDLHNLVPAIGEANAARRDYRFSEFILNKESKEFNFHGCKIWISNRYRAVEPKGEIKGFIARAHLYMAHTYSLDLSKHQLAMFIRWNESYPPAR